MKRQYKEDDLGADHDRSYLVEDAHGTVSAAHYHEGVWWEGHPPADGKSRIQLDHRPIKLADPEFGK